MSPNETHEPEVPSPTWPDGHVSVERESRGANSGDRVKLAEIGVSITGPDEVECIRVTLADYEHFLHSSTARELGNQLAANDRRAVSITIHDVIHTAGVNASRALRQTLERRLIEWNKVAVSNGEAPA
jgi:hypothetical protein